MFLAKNVVYLTTKVSILFTNQTVFTKAFGAGPNSRKATGI